VRNNVGLVTPVSEPWPRVKEDTLRRQAGQGPRDGATQGGPSPEPAAVDLTTPRRVELNPQEADQAQAAVDGRFIRATKHRNSYLELSELGRYGDALAQIAAVVQLCREIVQLCPPPLFRPELAQSLLDKGKCLRVLCRPDGLVDVATEAVALCRELVEGDFARFSDKYGEALSALSVDLSSMGRYEEAVAVNADLAKHWYQMDRAGLHPGRERLAGVLTNESSALEALGRHDEALIAAGEAVFILREMAEADPGANRAILGAALNNLSVRLAKVGKNQEALSTVAEAIVLRRALAAGGTPKDRADLSSSLGNQSNYLAKSGQLKEALGAVTEAVGIMRELVEIRPEKSAEGLAPLLTERARCLANLGRHEEAVSAAAESVALFERLHKARPPLKEKFAFSLRLLGAELDQLGRGPEADGVRARAHALSPGAPSRQTVCSVGPSFSQALANLDTLTEESIRASFACRDSAAPAAAAVWRATYGFTQAEARRNKVAPLVDLRRAAYLAAFVADGLAPAGGRQQDGFLELAWHCDWDAYFSLRWDEATYVWGPGFGPRPDVEDLVRLWELRAVGPGIMAIFAGTLTNVLWSPADVRLVLDKLVGQFEPGSPEMAAAVGSLNQAPRREGSTLLERVDIDAAISSGRARKNNWARKLPHLEKSKCDTTPEVPGPDDVLAPLFDHPFKYVWTIDAEQGEPELKLVKEQEDGVTVACAMNISRRAAISGEAWFSTKKDVYITNASSDWGFSATVPQWLAAIRFWESLGYKVHPIRFSSYEILKKWRTALP
jgi:tetratricopeptide (TPR) repeat protein